VAPVLVIGVLGLGYLVAGPALLWHRRDLMSFRRPLWAGYGSRRARLRGAVVCYVAFGWPELLMALGWRSSKTRSELVNHRQRMRDDREDRAGPHVGNAAP
jgi:hypothetical protein